MTTLLVWIGLTGACLAMWGRGRPSGGYGPVRLAHLLTLLRWHTATYREKAMWGK